MKKSKLRAVLCLVLALALVFPQSLVYAAAPVEYDAERLAAAEAVMQSGRPSGLVVFEGDYTLSETNEPTEASEMFHILKNAENPHFYGFRLHTFRTTDKVVRYGINNQFDFAEHPAVIQRGEKRTINICVAVPDVA